MSHSVPDLTSALAAAASVTAGLRVVCLFGSVLTGRTWAESDVDIGVRWEPQLDLAARVRAEGKFAAELESRLPGLSERLDLVDLDRCASSVAFKAIREGVWAWSQSERERVDAVVRISRRYDDEAPWRALFRQAARASADRMAGEANG